ncbi:MAG: T9SS type A sorting domain-containing protein [Bacteroidia bacterium]
MLHRIFLSLLFLFLINSCLAQSTFQRQFKGGIQLEVLSEPIVQSGGFIIAGTTDSFALHGTDMYLIRLNENGDTLWSKTYDHGQYDVCQAECSTDDGGFLLAGRTEGITINNSKALLIKTDSTGHMLWTKTYGGPSYETAIDVRQTKDSGFIIAAETHSYGAGNKDIFMIKTNSVGDTIWTKVLGGVEAESVKSVCETSDDGYAITGVTFSFSNGSGKIFLVKMDRNGNVDWTKIYGGNNWDYGSSVLETPDRGFILTGITYSTGAGVGDVIMIKTDSIGNRDWAKTYGGTNTEVGMNVKVCRDGGFIVLGQSISFSTAWNAFYLIRTDRYGDTLWTRAYGEDLKNIGTSVEETALGGFVLSGYRGYIGSNSSSYYLIQTDSDGFSGCAERFTATQVMNSSLNGFTAPFVITQASPQVLSIAMIEGSGSEDSTLCSIINSLPEFPNSSLESLIISPNPSNEILTIEFIQPVTGEIDLHSLSGECVFHSSLIQTNKLTINTGTTLNGIFILKVNDGNSIYCKKVCLIAD